MKGYEDAYLTDAEWLREHLSHTDVQVLDVRAPASYLAGHIPGAINLPGPMLRPTPMDTGDLAALAQRGAGLLAQVGVNGDGTIVVYEESAGTMAAYVAWFLGFVGHPDARLLEGGFVTWIEAGHTLAQGPAPEREAGTLTLRLHPERLATAEWLRDHLDDPSVRVLDARSATEYAGYEQRAARAGAIPGAVNFEWSEPLAPDGSYRPAAEVREQLAAAGVDPDSEVVVYCQSGARSSHLAMTLQALGYRHVRNYVGSWGEWAERSDLPIMNAR